MLIPAYLSLDEVLPQLPSDWSRRRKMRALRILGLLSRTSQRSQVVATQRLGEQLPAVYQAILDARILRELS